LVKTSGQKYVDTINQTVEVMTQAWQEYADRLEKTADNASDKAQQAARTAIRESVKAAERTKKSTSSKKSS
jgi:hypothetical protein